MPLLRVVEAVDVIEVAVSSSIRLIALRIVSISGKAYIRTAPRRPLNLSDGKRDNRERSKSLS